MNKIDISGIKKEELIIDWCAEAEKCDMNELKKAFEAIYGQMRKSSAVGKPD